MEDNASSILKTDVIDYHGRKGALSPTVVSQTADDGGFFDRVSSNPFFTAVSKVRLVHHIHTY